MRFFFLPVVAVSATGLFGDTFDDELDGVIDAALGGSTPGAATVHAAAPATSAPASVAAPTTATTSTAAPTTAGPVVQKFELKMRPRFIFGVRQFRRVRAVREDQVALCPSDRSYCIDSRHSDSATCMYPSPLEIKRCLDRSCQNAPENDAIFAQFGEPSYCKDYMAMPEGRICHWGTTFCSCPEFDIEYANALVQVATEAVPAGFRRAADCFYPDDYKAENNYEGVPATLAPVPAGGAGPRARLNDPSGSGSLFVLGAALVALLAH